MNLYDVAREVTDDVFGKGTYASLNKGNPNPEVQAAIKRDPIIHPLPGDSDYDPTDPYDPYGGDDVAAP